MVKRKYLIVSAGIAVGIAVLAAVIVASTLTKPKEGTSSGLMKITGRGLEWKPLLLQAFGLEGVNLSKYKNITELFLGKLSNKNINLTTMLPKLIEARKEFENIASSIFSIDFRLNVKLSAVKFSLYTRKNKDKPFVILNSDVNTIRSSYFDPSKKILLICHGWRNNLTSPINDQIKDAALKSHDVNVFITDWGSVAFKGYWFAKNSVFSVGTIVGNFLNKIQIAYGLDGHSTVLVGHSLGAHIVGNAGSAMQKKPSYIVGLDPADPAFNLAALDVRLDKTDGEYVQIIHTSGVLLGVLVSIGHVDYFPNGGLMQPGCGVDSGVCAHSRSYEYFAESLERGPVFLATKCQSYTAFLKKLCLGNPTSYMGQLEPDRKAQGDYYLATNSEPPYGLENS